MSVTSKARVVVAPTGQVHVYTNSDVLYDLKAVQDLQVQVLGKLGCRGCCSGHQLIFQHEEGEFGIG